jgi:hypothetical protein
MMATNGKGVDRHRWGDFLRGPWNPPPINDLLRPMQAFVGAGRAPLRSSVVAGAGRQCHKRRRNRAAAAQEVPP